MIDAIAIYPDMDKGLRYIGYLILTALLTGVFTGLRGSTFILVGGRFGADDLGPTVLTTACLVAGLPFLGLAQLFAKAFYAVGDTSTPARTAAQLVVANFAISVTLLMTTSLGTAALTLASSIASMANAWLLSVRFQQYAAPTGGLTGAWTRALVAGGAMCVVVPFAQVAGDDAALLERAVGDVGLPVLVGVAVYVGAHVLMRSPELKALRRRRG